MTKMMESIGRGRTYVIAEMSANHAGRLENALAIVEAAAESGADCLKVQTYTADTITIDCDKPDFQIHDGGLWDGRVLHDLYEEASMPWDWQPVIKEECERRGLDFLSTPFDRTAVDFMESMGCDMYKIASFELVDIPLIEYAASKGRPMIVSCGMGSVAEIRDAVDACHRAGNDQVVLLKCCSEYPANWPDMHLANIPDMRERFGTRVGLSDHSTGHLAAVVGVSMGACVVEKHFCLDRAIKNPDSEFSMEPAEFREMVRAIRDVEAIRGDVSYGPSPREEASLAFRRSLYAVEDIAPGEPFTQDNVRSIRPSHGLEPKHYASLMGRPAKRAYGFGDPISAEEVG